MRESRPEAVFIATKPAALTADPHHEISREHMAQVADGFTEEFIEATEYGCGNEHHEDEHEKIFDSGLAAALI